MKTTILLIFTFLATLCHSQIDYSLFYNTWCKCLPKDGVTHSDTIKFMTIDQKDSCKTNRYSEHSIYNENLHYTFFKNDSLTIYKDGGHKLRSDYIPDSTTNIIIKNDTIIDSLGRQKIHRTETTVKVPIRISSSGSAATLSVSNYKLDKDINKLVVLDDNQIEYEILRLSEKELVLYRINRK